MKTFHFFYILLLLILLVGCGRIGAEKEDDKDEKPESEIKAEKKEEKKRQPESQVNTKKKDDDEDDKKEVVKPPAEKGEGKDEKRESPVKSEKKDDDGEDEKDGIRSQVKTEVLPDTRETVIILKKEQQDLIDLKVEAAVKKEVEKTLKSFGKVVPKARAEAEVSSPVSGRITPESASLISQVGTQVEAGQILAEVEQTLNAPEKIQLDVDTRKVEADIAQAREEMGVYQAEHKRAKDLYNEHVAPLKRVQEAELAYKLAEIKYKNALQQKKIYTSTNRSNISHSRRFPIKAPISGTLTLVDITAGQQVDPSQNIFTIVNLSTVWVEAQLFEEQLHYAQKLKKTQMTFMSYPDEIFEGDLVHVGDVLNPETRAITLLFEVKNPDRKLKIGMQADVAIPLGEKTQAVLVPTSALLDEGGKKLVFIKMAEDKFVRRNVTFFSREGNRVALSQGVKEGDEVVTMGAQELLAESLKYRISVSDDD
jgi:cobalt-zinc-cadmium efflux system membrane fusion protein